MNLFPAVDPIPLPAPVALFKLLHVLTLALHFTAMQMLVGGLLAAIGLSMAGRAGSGPCGRASLDAAGSVGRRLPVVMTYVINLGVPPLLFAQVLYGRAIYTSSVLIGVYWISVIALLTLGYWLLYRFAARTEGGRTAWWLGLPAWLIVLAIAKIYSVNMTLMLRPDVWASMYAATATGTHFPPSDPSVALMPRWLFMLSGGLTIAGLWLAWLSGRKNLAAEVRNRLSSLGGYLAVAGIALQAGLAWLIFKAQPEAVRSGLTTIAAYQWAGYIWFAIAALILLFGLWNIADRPVNNLAGALAMGLAFGSVLSMTLYRDGIRDLTLKMHQYDVWNREVVANWSVVILFLLLFVGGLGVAGWLISVVARAKPVSEKVVS